MTGKNDAVVLTGVSKSYDVYSDTGNRFFHRRHISERREVLSNIDLRIKKGEVVGIVGRNGSGKSTLLKIISGILKPTDGTVEVNGNVMGIMETGLPFQFGLPGIENIYLRGMFYGLSKAQVDEIVDDIIEFSELGEHIFEPMRTYSSGMSSRLMFSIMIHLDADVYIFDEALRTGDELFNRKAAGYIHSLAKKGKTVILTSHSRGMLGSMRGRAILLEDGTIALDGPWDYVLTEYRWGPYRDDRSVRSLAETGDPEAMYILSKSGAYKSESKREELMRSSAEKDFPPAIAGYADIEYDRGNTDVSSQYYGMLADDRSDECMLRYAMSKSGCDFRDLMKMFKDMATVGDHFDEFRYAELSRILSIGSGSAKRAFDLYSRAYGHGNLDAGYMAACLMLRGIGTDLDVKKALKILTELAKKNHLASCVMMSKIHFEGKYVRNSPRQAFKWCSAAANLGDPLSQFRLIVMYSDGIGVKADAEEAKRWADTYIKNRMSRTLLSAASTLEYSDYRFNLREEDLYRIGMEGLDERSTRFYLRMLFRSGTDKDREKAFDAINRNCMTSFNAIYAGRYHGHHSSPEFSDGESFRLMKISADSGNEEAMYLLANMYGGGFGTEKDRRRYERVMRSAARMKSQDAKRIIDKDGQTVKRCMNRVYRTSSRKRREHEVSIVKNG